MKSRKSVLIGAALLMATSAVGPGFLTQSAIFTATYTRSLAIVIIGVVCMDMITQSNVWSVICASGMRAQDIANKVLPGLGYVIAGLVAFGGLAFNIANVGGISLGLYAMLGVPVRIGCILGGGFAVCVFLSKSATGVMDRLTQVLGALIVVSTVVVAIVSKPPVESVVQNFFNPGDWGDLFFPMITLLGGSCGGYISFAGAHRLLDADIKGVEQLSDVRKSVLFGTSISGCVRIMMFLATLGVCTIGGTAAAQSILNAENPAAQMFSLVMGQAGFRLFGFVLFCASLTSVIGAAYTSVSFLKTLNDKIMAHEKHIIVGFIVFSTIVMAVFGNAAKLLVVAGGINGLILPVLLIVILIAAHKKQIVGETYKHSIFLTVAGTLIAAFTLYAGLRSVWTLIMG